jgi:hypothetical protein
MSTQPAFLGFTSWTVDAIAWTPIYLRYAYREHGEALIENAGDVTVNLRTVDTDSTKERPLLSGENLPFKTGEIRGTEFAPVAPIAYAKAASGTSTLRVIER